HHVHLLFDRISDQVDDRSAVANVQGYLIQSRGSKKFFLEASTSRLNRYLFGGKVLIVIQALLCRLLALKHKYGIDSRWQIH
ncbi:MAG: hypothetical protein WBL87_02970, partial [Methanothrix sp.]